MKITGLGTVLLTGPCTNDRFLLEARKLRSAAFIEVHTDGGVVGLGETYAGYFCPEIVPQVVEFFEPILVGQAFDPAGDDPTAWIDTLWQRMYQCGNFWCRVGLGVIVLNGIEAALWDMVGKAQGKPVYELLGGPKHDRLPCYATGGPSNYPKDRLREKADYYLSLGFRGLKVGAGCVIEGRSHVTAEPGMDVAAFEGDKAAFLRDHVGPDVNLLMDGHMGNAPTDTWNLDTAQAVMQAVEPYDLFLYEEPLHYTDPWSYSELAKSTRVPIAGGECLTGMYEWRVFAERDCFDIAQPDASFTGGLLEFMRVAEMFAASNKKIATHAWGAGGSLMQNIHCGFAAASTCILEIPPDFAGLHSDIMIEPFTLDSDGCTKPPALPGLGIALTDDIKARYPFQPGSGEFNSVPGKVLST